MTRIVASALLMMGVAVVASAEVRAVPEINAGLATNAVALVTGAALVVRSKLKK